MALVLYLFFSVIYTIIYLYSILLIDKLLTIALINNREEIEDVDLLVNKIL